MTEILDRPTRWGRLYAAAALASGVVGLLVGFGLLPAIPDQITAWKRTAGDTVALTLLTLGCALVGLILTGVAHLGVVLQLRRRSGPRTDKP
jgi:hypothetical protein